jgi:hypothetical protein
MPCVLLHRGKFSGKSVADIYGASNLNMKAMLFRKVGVYIPKYTASHSSRRSPYSQPGEYLISQKYIYFSDKLKPSAGFPHTRCLHSENRKSPPLIMSTGRLGPRSCSDVMTKILLNSPVGIRCLDIWSVSARSVHSAICYLRLHSSGI